MLWHLCVRIPDLPRVLPGQFPVLISYARELGNFSALSSMTPRTENPASASCTPWSNLFLQNDFELVVSEHACAQRKACCRS